MKKDFSPNPGAYNPTKYPACFELQIPYQIKQDSNGFKTDLFVNMIDVERAFKFHFGHQSEKALQTFTEKLMKHITPDQVERAVKEVARDGL